jgi:hypothetical protein
VSRAWGPWLGRRARLYAAQSVRPSGSASALKNLRQAGARSSEIFVVYHNAAHAQLVRDAGFTQVWSGDGDLIFTLG